jgi:large subunit ribosomal protein L6
MVEGVTTGFKKTLEIVGVGYRAENKPFGLTLQLGYSHPIDYKAPEGIALKAVSPTVVEVEGRTRKWSVRSRPRSGRCVRPSRTRARA